MDNMFINLGREQRLTRKILGVLILAISIVLSLMMIFFSLNIELSIIVFLLYAIGILLMLEARNAVCVGVAIFNHEAMTGRFSLGNKTIQNNERSRNVRKIVKNLTFQSFLSSFAITSVVLILYISFN